MDSADPQPDGLYIDSLSNLVDFGIKDAMDIHHTEEYFLGTFDELGQGGAHKMHKYTWNKILVPLDLVSTKLESVETFVDMTDQWAIIKWCQEVKPRSVEEIKDDDENIVVADDEIEVVKEVGEESSDVMEEVGNGNSDMLWFVSYQKASCSSMSRCTLYPQNLIEHLDFSTCTLQSDSKFF